MKWKAKNGNYYWYDTDEEMSSDTEDEISPEDIAQFKADFPHLVSQTNSTESPNQSEDPTVSNSPNSTAIHDSSNETSSDEQRHVIDPSDQRVSD